MRKKLSRVLIRTFAYMLALLEIACGPELVEQVDPRAGEQRSCHEMASLWCDRVEECGDYTIEIKTCHANFHAFCEELPNNPQMSPACAWQLEQGVCPTEGYPAVCWPERK